MMMMMMNDEEQKEARRQRLFFEGSPDRRLNSYAAVFDFERVSWILFCLH